MPEFRLSSLLRVRRVEQDAAAAELAGANRRARDTEKVVARTRRALADFGDEATSTEQLRAIAAARLTAANMLGELTDRGARDAELVASAQTVYRGASTAVRTLSKLEDRWTKQQQEAELAAEQAVLDDLVSARAARGAATKGAVA